MALEAALSLYIVNVAAGAKGVIGGPLDGGEFSFHVHLQNPL